MKLGLTLAGWQRLKLIRSVRELVWLERANWMRACTRCEPKANRLTFIGSTQRPPLLFGCVDGPRAYVVLSKGPDREVGTPDDLIVTAP